MNYEYDEILTFKKPNVKKPKKKKIKKRTIEDIQKEREEKKRLEDEKKLKEEQKTKEEEKDRLENLKEIEKQVIDSDLNLLEEDLKDFSNSTVKVIEQKDTKEDTPCDYDFM